MQCVLQRKTTVGYWGSLWISAVITGFSGSLTTVSTFVTEVHLPLVAAVCGCLCAPACVPQPLPGVRSGVAGGTGGDRLPPFCTVGGHVPPAGGMYSSPLRHILLPSPLR